MGVLSPKAKLRNDVNRKWHAMISRCNDPKNSMYYRYGGRGIRVCDRWMDFDNYFQDNASGYAPGLSLDRIDNDGNYEPGNVRWVDMKTQARNKSNTRFFTINGETKPFGEWVELSDVKKSTVYQRFYVYKWDIEKSLGIGG